MKQRTEWEDWWNSNLSYGYNGGTHNKRKEAIVYFDADIRWVNVYRMDTQNHMSLGANGKIIGDEDETKN